MSDTTDRAVRLCLQLLADWLRERTAQPMDLAPTAPVPDTTATIAAGELHGRPLAVALAFIVPPDGEGPWYAAKRVLEERLSARLAGGYLIWVPQGAELPEREPATSEFILRAEETLARFVPGGHGEIRFPVAVYLRKSDEQGSYVTARGGLAPHWARFTNRVDGHFQLDSRELHRLPAGEGHLRELIERIVQAAGTAELGRTVEVPCEDAWAAQRLRGGSGVALIGEPPGVELSAGAGLRRSLRRTLQAVRGPLLAAGGEARVLCLIGPYTYRAEQPVGTALLGFDPALYQGIDLICLACEGEVMPLLDLTRHPLLAPRAAV
jgi:hypothetical protein